MRAEARAVLAQYEAEQNECQILVVDDSIGPQGSLEADIIPECWTPEHVSKRLIEAAMNTLRLPKPRGPRDPGNHWPEIQHDWEDRLAWATLPMDEQRQRDREKNRTIVKLSSQDLTRMDACYEWLRVVGGHHHGWFITLLKWSVARARGQSDTELCDRNGWAYSTFYVRRRKALNWLAAMLNKAARPVF
jgi:hypothetical protein